MTPEERARDVVMTYYAEREWGYDPNQHAEYEQRIAAAIRAAVEQEREECASIAHRLGGYEIAAAIRAHGSR